MLLATEVLNIFLKTSRHKTNTRTWGFTKHVPWDRLETTTCLQTYNPSMYFVYLHTQSWFFCSSVPFHKSYSRLCKVTLLITPPPVGGRGIAFGRFISFFVSLSAILRENGRKDLHEIFRDVVEWPWDKLITFWVNSGKWVGGSKVSLFVITGHSSEDWR